MRLYAVAFVVLMACSPVRAADETTVDKAIEKLNQICLSSRTFAINLGGGGELKLTGKDGGLLGTFKLTVAEIFGLADKLRPEDVGADRAAIRQCMLGGLDRMFAALSAPSDGPTIVLMDSLLAPYRKDMPEAGQTNGDDLTAALKLLSVTDGSSRKPVRIIKETTGLRWERETEVFDLKPNLIFVHFSAFESPAARCEPSPKGKPNACFDKFFGFARRAVEAGVPLIIYSRIPNLCQDHKTAFQSQLTNEVARSGKGKVYLLQMGAEGRKDFTQALPKEDAFVLARAALKSTAPPPGQYCMLFTK